MSAFGVVQYEAVLIAERTHKGKWQKRISVGHRESRDSEIPEKCTGVVQMNSVQLG
jgi:hypothetical protein